MTLIAIATFFSAGAVAISIAIIVLVFAVIAFTIAANMPEPSRKLGRFAFYLLCAYLFLLVVWPRYALLRIPGLPGLSPPRFAQLVLELCWVYLIFKSSEYQGRLRLLFSEHRPFVYLLLALFLFKAASIFVSIDASVSIKGVVDEVVSIYVFTFITATVVDSRRDVHVLFFTFVVATFLVMLLGVYESTIQRNIFLGFFEIDSDYLNDILREKERAGSYRIQSTFSHPLTLWECVVMAVPAAIMVFLRNGLSVTKLALLCGFVGISAYVIYKTGSRSGLGTYLFVIFFSLLAVIVEKTRRAASAIHAGLYAIALLLVAVISLLVFYGVSEILVGRTTREFNSGLARLEMWRHGLFLAQQSPIIGYGQNLAAVVLGFAGYGGTLTIDSYYLTILLESGFSSLVIFVLVMAYIIKKSLSFGMSKDKDSLAALLLLNSLLGFFIIKAILSLSHNRGIAMIIVGSLLFLVSRGAQEMQSLRRN